MRILSEDRGVDIPYEQSIIVIDDECIKAVNLRPDKQFFHMSLLDLFFRRKFFAELLCIFVLHSEILYARTGTN